MQINEISNNVINYLSDFIDDVKAGHRKLSFERLFEGNLRLAVKAESIYPVEMAEIIRLLEAGGWSFDLKSAKLSRKRNFTIPAGPRAGEEIFKKEEISLSKFLSKFLFDYKSYVSIINKHYMAVDILKTVADSLKEKDDFSSINHRDLLFGTLDFDNHPAITDETAKILKTAKENKDKTALQMEKKWDELDDYYGYDNINIETLFPYTLSVAKDFAQDKNFQKIEKFINYWDKNQNQYHENAESLLQEVDYFYIISRSPIDVVRMADFSGMKSCHAEGESYFACAVAEAHGHGPIAYLVRGNDYRNFIESGGDLQSEEIFSDEARMLPDQHKIRYLKPISRLRFRRVVHELDYELAIPEDRVYGSGMPMFRADIKKWALKEQLPIIVEKHPNISSLEDLQELGFGPSRELFFHSHGASYSDTPIYSLISSLFNLRDRIYSQSIQPVSEPTEEDYEDDPEASEIRATLEAIQGAASNLEYVNFSVEWDEDNIREANCLLSFQFSFYDEIGDLRPEFLGSDFEEINEHLLRVVISCLREYDIMPGTGDIHADVADYVKGIIYFDEQCHNRIDDCIGQHFVTAKDLDADFQRFLSLIRDKMGEYLVLSETEEIFKRVTTELINLTAGTKHTVKSEFQSLTVFFGGDHKEKFLIGKTFNFPKSIMSTISVNNYRKSFSVKYYNFFVKSFRSQMSKFDHILYDKALKRSNNLNLVENDIKYHFSKFLKINENYFVFQPTSHIERPLGPMDGVIVGKGMAFTEEPSAPLTFPVFVEIGLEISMKNTNDEAIQILAEMAKFAIAHFDIIRTAANNALQDLNKKLLTDALEQAEAQAERHKMYEPTLAYILNNFGRFAE